jgi:ATP-dependent exoDNAse (exonuclease V) alpha subunit
VEKIEKQKNSQLAREIEVALPAELPIEQNISLVHRYVNETFVAMGMCADVTIHDTGKGNPHAHIMLTMRPINEDGSCGAKVKKINKKRISTVDWNSRDKAEEWRKAWAAYANGALRLNGVLTEDNVLDHRSYERQGIEQMPTIHLGIAASQMEKKGIPTDRGNINLNIEVTNKQIRQLRARINRLKDWLKEEIENPAPAQGCASTMSATTWMSYQAVYEDTDVRIACKYYGRILIVAYNFRMCCPIFLTAARTEPIGNKSPTSKWQQRYLYFCKKTISPK